MSATFKSIGVIVIGIVMMSFPILLTCSFLLDWYDFIKLILILATFFDLVFLCNALANLGD